MVDVSVGNWPAYVEVFSHDQGWGAPYVQICSDHNTQDYDTTLDRNQVTALRDALNIWLEETDA